MEANDSKITFKTVEEYVNQQINYIKEMPENKRKAMLAELRHGVGKTVEESPDCWGNIFVNMPDNMLGNGSNPSFAENAVYHSVTLFALHQQGKDIDFECMHTEQKDKGFGASLSELLSGNEDKDKRVEKRFKILVSSKDINGIVYYLRQMISILSKESIRVNYGILAGNLFDYQFGERRNSVLLRWGRQFYFELNGKRKEKERIL